MARFSTRTQTQPRLEITLKANHQFNEGKLNNNFMIHLRKRSRDSGKSSARSPSVRRMNCAVRMTTRGVSVFIFVGALVAVAAGSPASDTPSPEDCMNPPMRKFGHECCRLPKARIWGDLRGSLSMCLKKMKEEAKQGQEKGEGEQPEMVTTTEAPSESAFTPLVTSAPVTRPQPPKRRGRYHPKKPHHLQSQPNDSCFMECVFEDQGFLLNKALNKDALLARLSLTLGRNEPWHVAAAAAVETCHVGLHVPANGTCHSGSEEMFRCVFKQLFFNCPDWLQNDYCMSLKEFYQKCPNGPPPDTMDAHTTAAPSAAEEGAEEAEDVVTTESEQQQ